MVRGDDDAVRVAAEIMRDFATRTGLTGDAPPRRYLWTDAFAVCNYVGLAASTGDAGHLATARRLVTHVHEILGRHRVDDARGGWLSGLSGADAARHPTAGGLRIGKPLPERRPDEPYDDVREWDRDGQYFHYLTKWMHALDQMARATGEPLYNLWARELAAAAARAFVYATPDGGRRMYWKMSVDLGRPLVASMGQHDPLDGFVTCVQLAATAARLPGAPRDPALDVPTTAFASMIEVHGLATADPLGLGGLLADAARLHQLGRDADGLAEALVAAALAGLHHHARGHELDRPAETRLAFRELGLAIGIRAAAILGEASDGPAPAWRPRAAAAFAAYAPLADAIVAFWREPRHQQTATWAEHRDIDEVMLATALAPSGFARLT